MPKPLKKTRKPTIPPRDVNQWARYMVEQSTAEPEPVSQDEVSRVMALLGRRGGIIGGKRRLETMTPDQRSDAASIAARARWAKRKPIKKR